MIKKVLDMNKVRKIDLLIKFLNLKSNLINYQKKIKSLGMKWINKRM
jgi:hypothetical protein